MFYLLHCSLASLSITDPTPYTALLGSVASLPCNLTPPTFDDSVALLLWYREDIANPIYTIDARTTDLGVAKHFINQHVLGGRAIFNLSAPVGVLELSPVLREDAGEYRCRADFRRARTINRILRLDVIVPITQITVTDHFGADITGNIAGPYNEGSTVNFTCAANGGKSVGLERAIDSGTDDDDDLVGCPLHQTYMTPLRETIAPSLMASLGRDQKSIAWDCPARPG